MRGMKALHDAALTAARASAAVEVKQLVSQHQAELARAIAREQKRKINQAAKV